MRDVDFAEVVEEIRSSARERRREAPEIEEAIQRQREHFDPEKRSSDPTVRELEFHLRQANLDYKADQQMPGTRFALLKRIVLRLIQPFSRQQVRFNVSVVRTLNSLSKLARDRVSKLAELTQEVQRLESELGLAAKTLQGFSHLLDAERRDKAIAGAREVYENSQSEALRSAAYRQQRLHSEGALDPFEYLEFEDRFRGSEGEIRARMEEWLPIFEHADPIIDLGCGRGEFLELLERRGVEAQGVEIDREMVRLCREKGLEVTRRDVFEHLEGIVDSSVGGFLCSHVIEHLDGPDCIRLIDLCRQKLMIGGVLVLQTPNPASLYTYAHSFYLDPTHVRMYHPLFIDFLLRRSGFSRVELRYSSPPDGGFEIPSIRGRAFSEFNEALEKLNSLVFGDQDFTAIAYR